MTTSGTTSFSINRDQLITGALRIVGGVSQGETPTPTQVTEAAEALNMLVKAWEADGMPLWAIKQYSLTLSASSSYNIGVGQTVNTAKPLKVIQAFLLNTSTNVRIPMRIITRDEYNRLGNITTTGQPIQVFYEPLNTYGVLHTFPTPDSTAISNTQINIVYQRPFEDFDASSDEPDFPQEWFEAIKFGLADRLSREYGLAIQERQDIHGMAMQLKQDALLFGTEEGSLFLQADMRNY